MICSVISPGTPDRPVKTPEGPSVKKGRQVVESIRALLLLLLLSPYVSASFLHTARCGQKMRCYLRPWIQESLSGCIKHAHSLTVIPLFFSLLPPLLFPTTISVALGELL